MKRKIALALAAVMTFASVLTVPFTAQAASINQVVNALPVLTGARHLRRAGTVLSTNLSGTDVVAGRADNSLQYSISGQRRLPNPGNGGDVVGVMAAPTLNVMFNNGIPGIPGQTGYRTVEFTVTLNQARWSILDTTTNVGRNFAVDGMGIGGGVGNRGVFGNILNSDNQTRTLVSNYTANMNGVFVGFYDFRSATGTSIFEGGNVSPATRESASSVDVSGLGVARVGGAGTAYRLDLPYVLEINYAIGNIATVTVIVPNAGAAPGSFVSIPVMGYLTANNANPTATLANVAGSNVITPGTLSLYSGATIGTTSVIVPGGAATAVANNVVELNPIIIQESNIGVIRRESTFILAAPAGFEFALGTHSQTATGSPVARALGIPAWNAGVRGTPTRDLGHTGDNPVPGSAGAGTQATNHDAGTPLRGFMGFNNQWNEGARPGHDLSVEWANGRWNDFGRVTLINLGADAGLHNMRFATIGVSDQAMIAEHDNRNLNRFPNANALTQANPVANVADRSRLVITLAGVEVTAAGIGQIHIEGLRLVPTAATASNPESVGAGPHHVRVVGSTQGHFNNSTLMGITTVNDVITFNLATIGHGVMFRTDRAATANAPNVRAGHHEQRADGGRVVIEEMQLGAWNIFLDTTFTLVDANGDSLSDYVKLHAVEVARGGAAGNRGSEHNTTMGNNQGNENFAGRVNNTTGVAIIQGGSSIEFSPDGGSVTFTRHFRNDANSNVPLAARFDFRISTAPNFTGPVYIEVSGSAVASLTGTNRVQIYNVTEPRVSIAAETTTVAIGQQVVGVANVVLTENFNNGLGTANDVFSLTLTEFGLPVANSNDIRFNPMSIANVTAPGWNIQVVQNTGTTLAFRILQRPNAASSVTLSGLNIFINHTVPFGEFGLAVTNSNLTGTGPAAETIQRNFNRNAITGAPTWVQGAFGGANDLFNFNTFGIQVATFIRVGTPPQQLHTNVQIRMSVAPGNTSAMVDGTVRTIMSHGVERAVIVYDGRTLIPLRAMAEFMGAAYSDLFVSYTSFLGSLAQAVFVNLGNDTAVFYLDTAWFMAANGHLMQMEAGASGNPVIIQVIDGVTYVPFRSFGNAFSIPVDHDPITNTVYFNRPVVR
jgi:hypothetical protein